MITLRELAERLKREEETYLLELLGLTSEDIVERFMDIIEDRYDEIIGEYEAEQKGFDPFEEDDGRDEAPWSSDETESFD